MKAIIFGANGQDGIYLKQLLEKNNIEVISISRNGDHIHGDISNYTFVKEQIKKNSPDYLFHLAANSTTDHSAIFDNHQAISTGTINILESVKLYAPFCKVFLSGSAMQFKNTGLPINEQTAFEGSSAYAVARIHSVYAARYYRSAFGIKVYVGYFFNHDSPLRSEKHVTQKIAKAVLRISKGSQEKVELNNISVKKEFGYAGDFVKAIWQFINQDIIFEAVIGTGKAYMIKDWLNICFNMINEPWEEHVIEKQWSVPAYDTLVSDPKIINTMGWRHEVNITTLAEIMLNKNAC